MISLRSVAKRYGDQVAVADLSLEIATGEVCVLVGPSGCGKTTTLKMINRLIEPTSGAIEIDGVDVLTLDAVRLRRGIGYVMQQGGLFPHRRVADNVATVPRLLGWDSDRVTARVDELLNLVGLDPTTYRRRYPHELSGGERQRVGVARALGADPAILLMDEPFGAVDPIARKRLQEEFLELQSRLAKTVVLVTHDIDEAIALGDRIAIMRRGGVVEQYDTPAAILSRPANAFVGEFVGADRDLRRLGVTSLRREAVLAAPTQADAGGGGISVALDNTGAPAAYRDSAGLERPFAATVELGASLRSVLVTMLGEDEPVVAVTDGGAYVGVLTLERLHSAIRQSAGEPVPTR